MSDSFENNEHWRLDSIRFNEIERARRDFNFSKEHGLTQLFISHSTRNMFTQQLKQRLIAGLSNKSKDGMPGMSYWADFLDLKDAGAVNWRERIETGIKHSAKVVAFIDSEFLRSFNCIIEVMIAMSLGKEVVPVIMDDESLRLMSSPQGSETVWKSSTDFKQYQGMMINNIYFNWNTFDRWWVQFTSINYCVCREIDFETSGEIYVMSTFKLAVNRNIEYLERWNRLEQISIRWISSGKKNSYLLPPEEITAWKFWVEKSLENKMIPMPSDLQTRFVDETIEYNKQKYRNRTILTWGIINALSVLLIISVAFGVTALKAQQRAEHNYQLAEDERATAQSNFELASSLLLIGDGDPTFPTRRREILHGLELGTNTSVIFARMTEVISSLEAMRYLIADFQGHQEPVNTAVVSNNVLFTATGGRDNTVNVYPMQYTKSRFIPDEVVPFIAKCDSYIRDLDFSDDDVLAVAVRNPNCTWKEKSYPSMFIDANGIRYSTDDRFLASVKENKIEILDILNYTIDSWELFPLIGDEWTVQDADLRTINWIEDYLVLGGTDRNVTFFNPFNGSIMFVDMLNADVNDIDVKVDSQIEHMYNVVVGFDTGFIKSYEISTFPSFDIVYNTTGYILNSTDDVVGLSLSPFDDKAVIITKAGYMIMIDIKDYTKISTFFTGFAGTSIHWSDNIIVATGDANKPFVFTAFNGFGLDGPDSWVLDDCEDNVFRSTAAAERSSLLAAGTYGGYVCMWDRSSRRKVAMTLDSLGAKRVMQFSPNTRYLAVGSDADRQNQKAGMYIYSTDNLNLRYYMPADADTRGVAWFPNNQHVAVGTIANSKNVIIWNVANHEKIVFDGHTARIRGIDAYFDEDTKTKFVVSSGNDNYVRLWSDTNPSVSGKLFLAVGQSSVAFVNGSNIIAGGADGNITEIEFDRETRDMRVVNTISRHNTKIGEVMITDKNIGTSSNDDTVRITNIVSDRTNRLDVSCRWAQLIHTNNNFEDVRLYCAKTTDNKLIVNFHIVDSDQAIKLVEDTTFGRLSVEDFQQSGYEDIQGILDTII